MTDEVNNQQQEMGNSDALTIGSINGITVDSRDIRSINASSIGPANLYGTVTIQDSSTYTVTDDNVACWTFIPKESKGTYYLIVDDSFRIEINKPPCWFHRTMRKLILGLKYIYVPPANLPKQSKISKLLGNIFKSKEQL